MRNTQRLLALSILLSSFIFLFSPTKAQELVVYTSPGIRLGYVFGEGFTWSSEITFGVWYYGFFSSVALGYQHIPKKPTSFNYIALQGGFFLFGYSNGIIYYKDEGVLQRGRRLSGFVGWPLAILSYEQLKFSSLHASYKTIGFWGKIPIQINEEKGGSLSTCFAEGTKITMADGSFKSIEDIQVGNRVLSYNPETGKIEPDEVLELYSPTNNNMMKMEFSDGTVVHSTFDHPYYVKDKSWCSLKPDVTKEIIFNISDIGQLEKDDICLTLVNGEIKEIKLVQFKEIRVMQTTYTIKRLRKNNAFFAEGILVGVETVKD